LLIYFSLDNIPFLLFCIHSIKKLYFNISSFHDPVNIYGMVLINCRYHLDLCKNVFGEGIFPDVDATNIYYGGTKIAG